MKRIMSIILVVFILCDVICLKANAYSLIKSEIQPYYIVTNYVNATLSFKNRTACCRFDYSSDSAVNLELEVYLMYLENNTQWKTVKSWSRTYNSKSYVLFEEEHSIYRIGTYKIKTNLSVYESDGTYIESETQEYTSYYQGSGCYN